MEKLDKVIAGLAGCIVCNCSNCEYFDPGCETGCTERLMKDAQEVIWDLSDRLTMAKDGRLLLSVRCQEQEEELAELRRELAAGVLRSMPNDWGEYPPEFPKEGM